MSSRHNSLSAFTHRNFIFSFLATLCSLCAQQVFIAGISLYVFSRSHSPLDLGYVGLSLFLPRFIFALFAGQAADHFNKKKIIFLARFMKGIAVIFVLTYIYVQLESLVPLYFLLFSIGTTYIFESPANQSMIPQLVDEAHFSNAVTWNSIAMQISMILGPTLGGTLYAATDVITVLLVVLIVQTLSVFLVIFIKYSPTIERRDPPDLKSLFAGLRFIFHKKIILGIISLDLFAVLLGGAVALLPIYANDILNVGASGYGLLRAGVPIGAALMAIVITHLPPFKNTGRTMLLCVAIFGVATVLFGLSKQFYLSMVCLVVMGAADFVSVVIRGVLVQTQTPQEMRGRVSAVNMMFIGASNELGEFESGVTAHVFGTVPAVVIGGVGTVLVVVLWSVLFPQIRQFKKLHESR